VVRDEEHHHVKKFDDDDNEEEIQVEVNEINEKSTKKHISHIEKKPEEIKKNPPKVERVFTHKNKGLEKLKKMEQSQYIKGVMQISELD
jgi:hypothetical protein